VTNATNPFVTCPETAVTYALWRTRASPPLHNAVWNGAFAVAHIGDPHGLSAE